MQNIVYLQSINFYLHKICKQLQYCIAGMFGGNKFGELPNWQQV